LTERPFIGTICASLLAAGALAQAPQPPSRTGSIPPGATAPQVTERTDPEYSDEARRARLAGTVRVSLIVDKEGLPRRIRVVTPLGLGLDEKAIEAVSQWRFAPGTKGGQPVAVMATIEVNFRLLDLKSNWHLERAVFQTP